MTKVLHWEGTACNEEGNKCPYLEYRQLGRRSTSYDCNHPEMEICIDEYEGIKLDLTYSYHPDCPLKDKE